MSNTFQVYSLPKKDRDIKQILMDYEMKHGTPTQILHVNKVDSESFVQEGLEVIPESWVMADHFFLEILEVEHGLE